MVTKLDFIRIISRAAMATLFCLAGLLGFAQSSSIALNNAENAGKWKTFLVNPNEVSVPVPPTRKLTKTELVELKKKMIQLNDKVLHQIYYWDAGSPAYRWNQIGYSLLSLQDFPTFVRTPTAWMNIAIHDATVAAWKAKYNYLRKRPSEIDRSVKKIIKAPLTPSYPCEHTMTAAAAATVLAYFFPQKADSLMRMAREASESRMFAGVQFPSDVDAAWKLGEQVAALVIEEAKKDGSDRPWTGEMKKDPMLWSGDHPVGVMVGTYKPLVLKSGNQFRPPAPPDFDKEMKELKDFKQNFHATNLAFYWAARSGFDVWTELANQKIFEYRLDDNAPACARIYTTMSVAMHEAAIVIMDAKYAYWGIRPFQYDTTYRPILYTPPFPGYPSGHATASSTAATVLTHFFPGDEALFRKTAQECADSRFYGGIHFRTDNEVGLEIGKRLGDYVAEELDITSPFVQR